MPETTQDEAALHELIATAGRVQTVGDVEGFVGLFSQNGILMAPGMGPVVGADGIRAFWTGVVGQVSIEVVSADVEEVVVSGDLGVVRVTYHNRITVRGEGSTTDEKGKSIWVVMRDAAGQWRCSRVIWNTNG